MFAADYINISINIFNSVICLLILFFVAASEQGKEKRNRIFVRIIIVNIVGVAAIIVEGFFNINALPENITIKKVLIILNSLGGPVILVFFIYMILTIIKERTTISKAAEYAAYIAVALCIVDIISAVVSMSIAMYPMANPSHYQVSREYNNWFLFSQMLSLICMAIGTGLLIMYKKILSKRELITLLSFIVLPLAAIIIEMYFLRGLMLISFSISVVIFIYYASIQNELLNQIKKKESELKKKELELIENRISIMMSQIKPHFLYNALSAIVQLCDENPALAKKTATDFSAYLRSNMDSLGNNGLISIEKEMDHVKHYLSLEKAIYGKALDIVYIIEAGGFLVPPLTIQPIVENAVKHGIGKKEGGGVITVSVSETEDGHLVTVSDDGAGYDTDKAENNEARRIGIDNVRKRLAHYGWILELSSKLGKGTTAYIKLPNGGIGHNENISIG